jgi:23S rRNA pseudouridine1911/1915/1917 synthase
MVKIPEIRTVPAGDAQPLDRLVRTLFDLSWTTSRDRIRSGKIVVDGEVCLVGERKIRPGSTIELRLAAPRPKAHALSDDAVAFVDAQVVVVRKPAGISTVPFDDEPGPTLDELVRNWLGKHDRRRGVPPLGIVHRLDKDTSGLLVFSRTWVAKQSLSTQFRFHTTQRRYLAIAHGNMNARTIRSELVDDRGDGLRGSRKGGRVAITHVDVIEKLKGATLVSCRLETGRTHQIRIHLSEAGHPIVGERVYIRNYKGTILEAPRLMLHATELGFEHPTTARRVRFEDPPPEDFRKVVAELQ